MRLDQVRAFVRCAELGGLSAAARAGRMPKSSLSRLIGDLEQTLNVRLLDRTTRGVRLTPEGYGFLGHARRILEEVDRAAASVGYYRDRPSGVVRITAPFTFASTFITPILPAFLAANPAMNVELELTARLVDLVEEGFDLAIRLGTPPSYLGRHRLMSNPLRLMASPAYIRRWGVPDCPEDLAKHPLLLIGGPRTRPTVSLRRGAETRVLDIAPRILSSDPSVVVGATLQGAGIGQIPQILVTEAVQRGDLTPVLADWSLADSEFSLLFVKGVETIPRVAVFMAFLIEQIAGLPALS